MNKDATVSSQQSVHGFLVGKPNSKAKKRRPSYPLKRNQTLPAVTSMSETQQIAQTQPVALSKPAAHRCTFQRSMWMRAGHVLSLLVPVAAALALVTPIYLCIVGIVDMLSLDAVSAKSTIGVCVIGWLLAVTFVTYLIRPFLTPSFGCHFRSPLFRTATIADSMGAMFIRMRIAIAGFVGCQLLAAMASFLLLGSNTSRWGLSNTWNPLLLLSVLFMLLGCTLSLFGNRVFLNTRGRKLKRWLHACWRGVALRSFIAEWDNQFREIFVSCRASRRLAMAYRSIKLGSAGCFAAAGCLAAITIGESIPGILFLLLSIVATLSVWPTARGIVDWTKQIVDPLNSQAEKKAESSNERKEFAGAV